MECPVCFEFYDAASRRPKCLPCGHTLCLQCLANPQLGRYCPQDRKPFHGEPTNFPDNFAMLEFISPTIKSRSRFGCKDCRAEANDACAEAGHRICSMRQLHEDVVNPLVKQLQMGVDASRQQLQSLVELERDLCRQLDACRAQMLEGRGQLKLREACLSQLQKAANDNKDLTKAVEEATRFAKEVCGTSAISTFVHSGKLDVMSLSRSEFPNQAMADLLQDEKLAEVRKVVGMDCGNHPGWTRMLLQGVAPRLVELEMSEAKLEHLEAVGSMPALRKLTVGCKETYDRAPALPPQLEELEMRRVSKQQLLSMRAMPALRKLRVAFWYCSFGTVNEAPELPDTLEELEADFIRKPHLLSVQHMTRLRRLVLNRCKFADDVSFPPHHGCPVQTLRLQIESRRTLMSVVTAFAPTLVDLELACASAHGNNDYCFYPDLAEGLRQCPLTRLRRLVLVRRTAYIDAPSEVLTHCAASCRAQVSSVWSCLLRKDAAGVRAVTVLCSECDVAAWQGV